MKLKVLLVEDEAALRMVLTDRLQSEGYAVECASNGDEGHEKATRLQFDLIILDVKLPGKNGFDVCCEIRKAGLSTPVLILTALGRTEDRVKGLKSGTDENVTKPFEMLDLMSKIRALLRRTARGPALDAEGTRRSTR